MLRERGAASYPVIIGEVASPVWRISGCHGQGHGGNLVRQAREDLFGKVCARRSKSVCLFRWGNCWQLRVPVKHVPRWFDPSRRSVVIGYRLTNGTTDNIHLSQYFNRVLSLATGNRNVWTIVVEPAVYARQASKVVLFTQMVVVFPNFRNFPKVYSDLFSDR